MSCRLRALPLFLMLCRQASPSFFVHFHFSSPYLLPGVSWSFIQKHVPFVSNVSSHMHEQHRPAESLRSLRALQVREAVFCCDYQKLFSLYEAAPNMGRALMDISYDKFRHAALNMAVRVYKPHVQVVIPTHPVSPGWHGFEPYC